MQASSTVNSYMPVSKKTEIDWKSVGRRLREIRGFDANQALFADELGVSQGQLSRYEQGRSEIGAAVLLRLARKSGKTIEWLLTGNDKP
jgi:transcriptional regulator with XRE-family HTH domain